MTADFSNLSPISSDPAQFHGLIGVTTQGDARLFAPSAFGTVTSVGLSVPTGLAVSGSPVTTSGTIALAFAPGYGIPTTVRQSEWDAAYNDKINTATFNTTNGVLTLTQQDGGTITINLDGRYLTSETDSQTLTWNGATGELSISGGNTVDLDGRYLTSFTESDPVFSASPAAGITAPQVSNWDTAFGWGNHAVAGYLLSSTAATTYQPLDGDLTAIGALAGTTGLLRKTAANTWSLDTATYLQSSAIGSTILAYDANLQSFANTFTLPTTDGTSGQVLTTNGAGVISFATVSGGGSGFDYIQSTPTPTATTPGQLWYKPTDGDHPGTAGLWRSTGAYWISVNSFAVSTGFEGSISAQDGSYPIVGYLPMRSGSVSNLLWVDSWSSSARCNAPADSSNYWGLQLYNLPLPPNGSAPYNGSGALTIINGYDGQGASQYRLTTSGSEVDFSRSIKALITPSSVRSYGIRTFARKVGTPGNLLYHHCTVNFNYVHP